MACVTWLVVAEGLVQECGISTWAWALKFLQSNIFIYVILILHNKNIFCHFGVVFCPVYARNGSVRCKYFIIGTCSEEHKAIAGKMAQSITQTMTQVQ